MLARHGHRKRWRPSIIMVVLGTLIFTGIVVAGLNPDTARLRSSISKQGSPLAGLTVIDRDTVRWKGNRVRLVGFDAAEAGDRARCFSERTRGEQATARPKVLISSGVTKLEMIRCSCRSGTEGSVACNFGRACCVLTVNGLDVGYTLVSEGLARPYRCGQFSCPPRGLWC